MKNEKIKRFIGVNEFEGIVYYSKENFEELFQWIFSIYLIEYIYHIHFAQKDSKKKKVAGKIVNKFIQDTFDSFKEIRNISQESGYRLNVLIERITASKSLLI